MIISVSIGPNKEPPRRAQPDLQPASLDLSFACPAGGF